MFPLRTICENKLVSQKIDEAIKLFPRIEEAFEGLKWRLAREPENGIKILGTNPEKYLFKITPSRNNIPSITILYEFDNHKVTILDKNNTTKIKSVMHGKED